MRKRLLAATVIALLPLTAHAEQTCGEFLASANAKITSLAAQFSVGITIRQLLADDFNHWQNDENNDPYGKERHSLLDWGPCQHDATVISLLTLTDADHRALARSIVAPTAPAPTKPATTWAMPHSNGQTYDACMADYNAAAARHPDLAGDVRMAGRFVCTEAQP